MTPRFITSEPAFKPHVSQSQAERARGVIHPMQTGSEFRDWRYRVAMAAIVIGPILFVAGWWS